MTKTTAPTSTLVNVDIAGLPDVDGVPFERALAAHFEPLTQYESAHGAYAETEPLTIPELMKIMGLASRSFGRERGAYVGYDDNDEGPFLVISTRNGGYDAPCWDTNDEDCQCNACIQNHVIPGYPGFSHVEHTDGDSANYFTLPDDLPSDRALPGSQRDWDLLNELHEERDKLIKGEIVPWFFAPIRQRHRDVLNDYGSPYDDFAWGVGNVQGDVKRKRAILAEVQESLTRLREAYAQTPAPAKPPAMIMRHKRGVSGKPLKAKEPIPVSDLATAVKQQQKALSAQATQRAMADDLHRLLQDSALHESTRAMLDRELALCQSQLASSIPESVTRAQYQVDMAYFQAPNQIQQLEGRAAKLSRRIEQIERDVARSQDSRWLSWPSDDHDAYAAWMSDHGRPYAP